MTSNTSEQMTSNTSGQLTSDNVLPNTAYSEERSQRSKEAEITDQTAHQSTAGKISLVRTVATSLTEGRLELRYTPRNAIRPSGDTH